MILSPRSQVLESPRATGLRDDLKQPRRANRAASPMPGRPDPDRDAARLQWQEIFGSPPPPYLSVAFMRKALSHDAQ